MSLFVFAAAMLGQTQAADYRQPTNWLCRPGRQDACATPLEVGLLTRSGVIHPHRDAKAAAPKADCFYAYPTASLDPTPNSDLMPDRQELGIVAAQLAPFGSVCRTFAPVYRQITLTAIRSAMSGKPAAPDAELAYGDVRAAWRDYLSHDNHGRPFVLIGHSQGSVMLKRLVAEEIDGKPVQAHMLSAILPGTSVLVPAGKGVGGDFGHVALCRSDQQLGCVLSWASYRDVPGPPENALFGKAALPFGAKGKPGTVAGCTNPAALGGTSTPLDPWLGSPWWKGGVATFKRPDGVRADLSFVRAPGLLSGRCVARGGVNYLAVKVAPGWKGPLADALIGVDTVGDRAYPDWGFHVVDLNVVEGNLIRLVARQTAEWTRQQRR